MSSYLWLLLRLIVIGWFFAGGWNATKSMPQIPASPALIVGVCAMAIFPARRFHSILVAQKKSQNPAHDWSASLWFSPLLKNPQSWIMTAGLSLVAFGLAAMLSVHPSDGGVLVGLLGLSFGLGVLAGLLMFRLRNKKSSD